MSIKSIRPIAPIASQMPSKSVAPIGATAPLKSISTGMRPIVTPEKGLPQIGPDKPKDTARDATYKSKRDDKLPYAFQSLSKFMPTSIINTSQKTFNSAYVNGFSNYNDFFGTLLKDFGPGQLKTYQTPSGSKDMYEYQYTNYLKYGNVNGPAQINEFAFRDGRWWETQKQILYPTDYKKVVEDATQSKWALNAQESEQVYQTALKNKLSEEQYKNLYNTAYAQKYRQGAGRELSTLDPLIKSYSDALTNGVKADPSISTTAQYGSIFGKGDPGIDFLKNAEDAFGTVSSTLGALGAIGLSKFANVGADALGAGATTWALGLLNVGSGSFSAGASAALGPIAVLPFLLDYIKNGPKYSSAILGVLETVSRIRTALSSGIVALVIKDKAKLNYDLVNSNGKIIDKYSDITSSKQATGIGSIANRASLPVDDIAAILGQLYRYRIVQKLNPLLQDYATIISDASSQKSFSVPEFQGR